MKRTVALLVVLLLLLFGVAAADYHFELIEVVIDISLDNSYQIQERIVANFSTPRHGIYREIPTQFGKVHTKIENLKSSEPIRRDSTSSGWTTFRLGSPDYTVRGEKEYLLSYSYTVGDDRNSEYDQFYYNVLGDGWQAPINTFQFLITFPKPIDPEMVFLTGGRYGSTALLDEFTISSDRTQIAGRASGLQAGEARTLRVQLPEGYFSEVVSVAGRTRLLSAVAALLTLVMLVHAGFVFSRYGREELFVPVVRFDAPSGLTPLEVGYLADGVVDNKDLTSMIFHWADGGYLTIEEGKKKQFTFTKIKDLLTNKAHERKLFDDFFNAGDGTTVTLKQLQSSKFGTSMVSVKTMVRKYFKGPRALADQKAERMRTFSLLYGPASILLISYALTAHIREEMIIAFALLGAAAFGSAIFTATRLEATWLVGSKFKRAMRILGFALLLLLLFIVASFFASFELEHSPFLSIAMAILLISAPALCGMYTVFTSKRSAYAQTRLEEIAGFMEFIKAVEVPRLELMVKEDPQLFYHVLGYAVVLGLEKTWAKKFATIAIEDASWYYGASPMRTALFYSALSNRLHTSVIEQAFYKQASGGTRSPISSSFGSSGFSGGGFGGGGGGAW
ncbi:MAG TPA: DUF2207 domain-containing protein [Sphaerochaeta sp.]|nr:DUF2207 domain-containing protein [Sphaerochaeta sp.]